MRHSGQGRGDWWRWGGAALILLLALHAGRVALARSQAVERPQAVLALWPGYSDALFSVALARIGAAAREGRAPAPAVTALVERAAEQAPLAPEPLWVAAAARMEAGDYRAAQRLLEAAIRLDPRAPAARFLHADLAVRQGRVEVALGEIAALERRLGGVSAGFAPALVTFLRQPGAAQQVAPALANNPPLRDAVLKSLAIDPADFPRLLALARPGDEQAGWYAPVVMHKLAQGRVEEVRQLQRRVAPNRPLGGEKLSFWGTEPAGDLFAWRFPQSRGGLAEPTAGGPLRLIHYGREETVLAEQLLLLPPGPYRLADRFAAPVAAGTFEWRLRCLAGDRLVAAQPAGATAGSAALLTVTPDCPVQKLSLVGLVGEVAQTVRADLAVVSLKRAR